MKEWHGTIDMYYSAKNDRDGDSGGSALRARTRSRRGGAKHGDMTPKTNFSPPGKIGPCHRRAARGIGGAMAIALANVRLGRGHLHDAQPPALERSA